MSKETVCTGCGATVTVQFGMLRDSFASPYCIGTTKFHTINETELPPLAIKPEAAPSKEAQSLAERIIWLATAGNAAKLETPYFITEGDWIRLVNQAVKVQAEAVQA